MQFIKFAVAAVAFSLWALSARAASISPADAASHVGETATVCGLVASAKYAANSRAQPTFLDMGQPDQFPPYSLLDLGASITPETTQRGANRAPSDH